MGRSLDGAVIAVVGAGGALGGRVARGLGRGGARVIVAGPHIERLPEGVRRVELDIRDPRAASTLLAATAEAGRLDGLVIASGVVAFGNLADTPPEVVEELMLVNALGPMWLIAGVLPALAEQRGFVAGISGVVAEQPLPGMASYAASKAAFSTALRAVRREVRRDGVSVCDLRPPHTETGLAGRAVFGAAPSLPTGLDPDAVAERIISAITADEQDVAAASF